LHLRDDKQTYFMKSHGNKPKHTSLYEDEMNLIEPLFFENPDNNGDRRDTEAIVDDIRSKMYNNG